MQTDISAVQEELDRILSSPVFAKSPRLSRFLRYVVEQKLKGNGDHIKEYTIAVEVFDEGVDFDQQADSTVRTEATKLRARLSRYYETDGFDDPIVIVIPKGAYIPVMENRRPVAGLPLPEGSHRPQFFRATPNEGEPPASGLSQAQPKRSFRGRAALIAAVSCTLLLALALRRLPWTPDVFARKTSRAENRPTTPGPQTQPLPRSGVGQAQSHYERARHFDSFGTELSITKAIDEYLLCLAMDSRFAPAYADLSMAYSRLMEVDTQRFRDLPKLAAVAAFKAVELDKLPHGIGKRQSRSSFCSH